ncbi:Fimbrial protein [Pseudomonas sp. UC 17F4]|uniref:fimbrial protein n=1 Tax=Pseudomonas sp. UC 17F4 TaxID=1855328 RepID=UPI00088D0BF4|nr:fimbrial protein [Pseudomonas sp. UC 17F4]SDQ71302.1 Fimbrial protein [Pseudomonas sp. UC 17F4]
MINDIMLRTIAYGAALLLGSALAVPCHANMEFTGTLITPPACVVSDKGGRIDVQFAGSVVPSKIDGQRYRQAIPYQIDCPGAGAPGSSYNMRLTLKAIATQFDPAAVQTSVTDLGIRILLGGTDFILNEPRQIDNSNGAVLPRLEAVPVKNPGATLGNGDFSASALLMAELY